jgi:glycerol-3-phosphate dehydrogenase subunit B
MLIVGFKELRDFYPALISQNLNAQNLPLTTEALVLDAPAPATNKVNITPLELAKVFENKDFRSRLVSLIRPRLKSYARVGFPAVLGLAKHNEVIADLEKQLGVPVFEISTLPPSVPGRRLFEALRHRLLSLGGRLIIGSKVHDGVIEDGQVKYIRLETSNRLRTITANNYILATGGIYGGGVQTDSDGGEGRVWEPIFGLPINANTNRHTWFAKGLLAAEGQPVSSYGITVNPKLNPVNGTNKALAENLYVVGSQIANSNWVIGRTGDGVALATATAAVNHILS